jgi:hypothetical protein
MSLESQLHAKADKVFDVAYAKLFEDFTDGMAALTGKQISDAFGNSHDALKPFQQCMALRHFRGDQGTRAVHAAVRDLHRERYVAKFIAKAEELAAFVDNGGAA